ncbi:MAG TPA: hypothetical protein VIL41_03115, partial [Coriobacteriia bacterium]
LHVFRYSRRPGTAAAVRPDQVPDAEKAARAGALRDLSAHLAARHAADRLGGQAEVLVERVTAGVDSTPIAEGTTRDYLRVRFSAEGASVGELAAVRLTRVEGDKVLGERLV